MRNTPHLLVVRYPRGASARRAGHEAWRHGGRVKRAPSPPAEPLGPQGAPNAESWARFTRLLLLIILQFPPRPSSPPPPRWSSSYSAAASPMSSFVARRRHHS
eukprot:5733134-Pyramimonas_sp.AAC.1